MSAPDSDCIGTARRTGGDGYSLVEVLAAAVLLAGVLLAIMTMFVAGGHQIRSGKLMTTAIAIAEDCLEEFRRLGHSQAYQLIDDVSDADTSTRYVWDSATWTFGAPPPANAEYQEILDRWKRMVEGEADADDPIDDPFGLPEGSMTITVRGLATLGDSPNPGDPPQEDFLADARILHVVVSIRWTERSRERSIVFETLKI